MSSQIPAASAGDGNPQPGQIGGRGLEPGIHVGPAGSTAWRHRTPIEFVTVVGWLNVQHNFPGGRSVRWGQQPRPTVIDRGFLAAERTTR
jgi:hypothetical protein